MSFAVYPAILFTVLLLAITAYSVLGGMPLLILKHDVPLDARFVQGFFFHYYRVALWFAVCACLSYLVWGRYELGAGAAVIAAGTLDLRRRIPRGIQGLGAQIAADDANAIQRFRRLHAFALVMNLALLLVLVAGVLRLAQLLA